MQWALQNNCIHQLCSCAFFKLNLLTIYQLPWCAVYFLTYNSPMVIMGPVSSSFDSTSATEVWTASCVFVFIFQWKTRCLECKLPSNFSLSVQISIYLTSISLNHDQLKSLKVYMDWALFFLKVYIFSRSGHHFTIHIQWIRLAFCV